ncbi:hypothetical protein M5K25_005224 [Dendrobium thyrsiflorum]|uniref:Uncharacterized protein n=1 Tax=Dendrobium thyrsiflorum TaxID=117978 RepID=A0ABD0VI88_DENTH
MALETQIRLEILCDLMNKPLEWQLSDEQLGILMRLFQGDNDGASDRIVRTSVNVFSERRASNIFFERSGEHLLPSIERRTWLLPSFRAFEHLEAKARLRLRLLSVVRPARLCLPRGFVVPLGSSFRLQAPLRFLPMASSLFCEATGEDHLLAFRFPVWLFGFLSWRPLGFPALSPGWLYLGVAVLGFCAAFWGPVFWALRFSLSLLEPNLFPCFLAIIPWLPDAFWDVVTWAVWLLFSGLLAFSLPLSYWFLWAACEENARPKIAMALNSIYQYQISFSQTSRHDQLWHLLTGISSPMKTTSFSSNTATSTNQSKPIQKHHMGGKRRRRIRGKEGFGSSLADHRRSSFRPPPELLPTTAGVPSDHRHLIQHGRRQISKKHPETLAKEKHGFLEPILDSQNLEAVNIRKRLGPPVWAPVFKAVLKESQDRQILVKARSSGVGSGLHLKAVLKESQDRQNLAKARSSGVGSDLQGRPEGVARPSNFTLLPRLSYSIYRANHVFVNPHGELGFHDSRSLNNTISLIHIILNIHLQISIEMCHQQWADATAAAVVALSSEVTAGVLEASNSIGLAASRVLSPTRAKGRESSHCFGPARLAAGAADEIEHGLGRFGEIGMGGEICVLLSFLHAPKKCAAIAAAQRETRHWRRSRTDGKKNKKGAE